MIRKAGISKTLQNACLSRLRNEEKACEIRIYHFVTVIAEKMDRCHDLDLRKNFIHGMKEIQINKINHRNFWGFNLSKL